MNNFAALCRLTSNVFGVRIVVDELSLVRPKWLRTVLVALAYFIGFSSLKAQVLDVDDVAPKSDSLSVKYSLFGTLQVDRPISLVYNARLGGAISVSTKRHFLVADFNRGFTFSGDVQLLNGGTGHLRHRFMPQQRLHPEFFIQGQWDEARGMKSRFLSGVNMRIIFISKDDFDTVFGTGFFYEEERWSTEGLQLADIENDITKTNRLIKWNNYVQLRFRTSDKIQWKLTGFFQTRPNSYIDQPRVAALFSMDVNLNNGLAFALSAQLLWDAAPVIPIPHSYFNSSNNLGYAN